MNPHTNIAKLAVENYIKEGKIIPPSNNSPEEFFSKRSGVFVTIMKDGKLRGCIGTYLPTKENIAQEIIQNAIAAATEDYRFGPLAESELPFLSYVVYIINPPEAINDTKELDPKKYGIIVKTRPIFSSKNSGGQALQSFPKENLGGQAENDVVFNGHMVAKTGLLLPDLEGVDTVEQQISIACQKAGINPEKEKILIYRFTTQKYE